MKLVRKGAGDWRPWKNGAGRMQDIAVWPEGASLDDFLWRLSMAEMTEPAQFSEFPGVNRTVMLVEGEGMELDFGGGSRPILLERPFLPFSFPGELAPHVRPIGGPVLDFNIMTRRGRFFHTVAAARPGLPIPSGTVAAIACGPGRGNIGEVAVDPGDVLVGPLESLSAAPWVIAIIMRGITPLNLIEGYSR